MKSVIPTVLKFVTALPVLLIVSMLWLQTPSVLATTTSSQIDTVTLENPLNGINSIDGLLVAILNIIMILMVPVIVFFIIYAGFKYVTAQGNAHQVEDATRALTYAIIGGVLILGAIAISQIIQNVVSSF